MRCGAVRCGETVLYGLWTSSDFLLLALRRGQEATEVAAGSTVGGAEASNDNVGDGTQVPSSSTNSLM